MESKKSIKADLEPKRTFFLQIGLIFSLAVTLFLLERKSYSVQETFAITPQAMEMAEEMMQITEQQQQSAPPAVVTGPATTLLNVVSNDVMVNENIAIDTEANLKTESQESKISGSGSGTKAEADVEDAMPFTIVEEQPTFPGGTDALLKFLGDNIKYPPVAKQAGISGTVILSFLVEKDGSISNVKVIHGIGGGCNEEAIRVVSMMPKWSPGKQRGKAVRTQFQIPLVFFLRSN